MKKTLLVLVPALLLTACANNPYGKEIKREEAITLAANFEGALANVKSCEVNFEQTSKKKNDKGETETSTLSSTYKANDSNELALEIAATKDTPAINYYTVKNETYEEVLYLANGTDIYAYGKSITDSFVYSSCQMSIALAVIASTYQFNMFVDPSFIEEIPENPEGYKIETHFYSKNDSNLTVTVKQTREVDPTAEETSIEVGYVIQFENKLLKNIETYYITNLGNTSEAKTSVSMSNESVSISLPSDWESHLVTAD